MNEFLAKRRTTIVVREKLLEVISKQVDYKSVDENRISVREKMMDLYQMTSLRSVFRKCGLEVH